MNKKITDAAFSLGCFWGPEDKFMRMKGVVETEVGFAGGGSPNPSYERLCMGDTGHAETIHLKYDPEEISYQQLLDAFWKMHDPTQVNRQGPDHGSQYRSIIFYYNDEQKFFAEHSLQEEQKNHKKKIATEIVKMNNFYRAEEYHQKYVQKTGRKVC